MKPKWHFALQTSLFVLGVVAVFSLALYIVSFVLFILDESDLWFVPSFGFQGLCLFLKSLPWVLISILILFLVLLQVLVRHYAFAYQRPLIYSALGILIFVVGGSLVVRSLGVHQGLSEYSEKYRIPLAHPLYEKLAHPKHNQVYPGVIIEVEQKQFLLQNRWQEVYEVYITTSTRFPLGTRFMIGDEVIVVGKEQEKRIGAFGIRKVEKRRHGMPLRERQPIPSSTPMYIEFVR